MQSKREEIVSALKALIKRQQKLKIDVDSVGEETRIDRIGFDSLSILDFMYDVEERFGIRTEPADLVNMERVSDLIDYLERKIAR